MNILRTTLQYFHKRYIDATFEREDAVVRDILQTIVSAQPETQLLEAGSGLGRFALSMRHAFPSVKITCVELNGDLVETARSQGLTVIQADVRDLAFEDASFDAIHCSHVIEHLAYPDITIALDGFMRLLKPNGLLILRTPLLSSTFYNDIDHIRPYPPQAILNYFHNPQQQKQGRYHAFVERLWYRTPPVHIQLPKAQKLSIHVNTLLRVLWTFLPWIHGRADGYILALKKQAQ